MLFVFVLILIFFTPAALFMPGQGNACSVITAVGIDKQNEEYEISLLTFIPTPNQTYLETNSIVAGKGDSIAAALLNASLTLGRKICLSHAKTTVVSTSLLENNISQDIDYLGRVASLSENTILICTDASAKEFLQAAQSLEKDIGLKLEELINYNVGSVYVTDTSLEAFFKGYYSQTGSSILGYLTLGEGSSDGGKSGEGSTGGDGKLDAEDEVSGYTSSQPSTSSGGGQSSGGDSSGGSQGQKKVLNSGEVVLIKNGKKVAQLDSEELHGINVINNKAIGRVITVSDIHNEKYKDATLTYKLNNKRVNISTKFENGHPLFRADVILGLELVEGKDENSSIKTNTEFSDIPPDIALKIEQYVKKSFADTLKILRENKTDVIGVTQTFEMENRKDFRKFLNSLDDPDDFLNFITFELIVRVQPD